MTTIFQHYHLPSFASLPPSWHHKTSLADIYRKKLLLHLFHHHTHHSPHIDTWNISHGTSSRSVNYGRRSKPVKALGLGCLIAFVLLKFCLKVLFFRFYKKWRWSEAPQHRLYKWVSNSLQKEPNLSHTHTHTISTLIEDAWRVLLQFQKGKSEFFLYISLNRTMSHGFNIKSISDFWRWWVDLINWY